MNSLACIFLIICISIIAIVSFIAVNKDSSKSTSRKPKPRSNRKYKTSNDDLASSLSALSTQISSFLGFDPTGGHAPYNPTQFQQYLSDSVQELNQSSGTIIPQFGQYIGKLLTQIQQVSPLETGSFDEQQLGTIAGALFLCVLVLDNTGNPEWESSSSDIIQDVGEAAQTYLAWLGDKKSSADTGSYLNDPVIYNLNMDTNAGFPSGTVLVLQQLIAAAKADSWYFSSNNMNKARAWYDLGMFQGFGCVFTADGNTC